MDLQPLSKEQIEADGWEIDNNGPSAEGPSFKKDKLYCQLLIKGNINGINAGLDYSPNLTIRTKYGTVFLGECKSITEFRKIITSIKLNHCI